MNLCTAADKSFREPCKVLCAFAKQYGWKRSLYDLGGLEISSTPLKESLEGWRFKPGMILDTLKSCKGELIYMDADAFPIAPIGHVFMRFDFDVAVTVRPAGALNHKTEDSRAFMGWTNAGMMFCRPKAAPFLQKWKSLTEQSESDQHALNLLLHGEALGRPVAMSIRTIEKTRVLFLPEQVYNHTGDPMTRHPLCKVVHLNGGRWKAHLKTMRVMAGMDEPREYR